MKRINKIINHSQFRLQLENLRITEKNRIFCHHNIDHLLAVGRIMEIKVLESNLNIKKEIIYATALLHDIGRDIAYKKHSDHALESRIIAEGILNDCAFTKEESKEILFAVEHHNDNTKGNELCQLLRIADKLSRNCFLCSAYKDCNWAENKKNKEIDI